MRTESLGRSYLALPDGAGPFPGVVVVHEASGLNDNIRDICGRFAAEGYAALGVDLFEGRNRAVCMARMFAGGMAGNLDYYGVPWLYEPRTFELETDEQGRVLEAFAPDFYLPEQDLYLEITVMKQSLVTRKNRKVRKLKERYPDVNIKLFYKRDIERLGQRYGLKLAS